MKIYTARVNETTGTNPADSYESTRKADVLKWAKAQAKQRNKGVVIYLWNGDDSVKIEAVY